MSSCQVIKDLAKFPPHDDDGGQILFFLPHRASLERVCAADPECVQDQPSTKSDDGEESGASSVVVGVLLLPLLVVHQL